MLNEIKKYAKGMNANEKVDKWVDVHLSAYLAKNPQTNQGEVEHIIDYLVSESAPKRLSKMSYDQAKSNSEKWLKAQIKKGKNIEETADDVKIIKEFEDGFKIVELVGKSAYEKEGFLMSHCVSSYYGRNTKIYSLRDEKNMPHATMEADGNQIKGKGNGPVIPKYVPYITAFLEENGVEVRESELTNLGYFKINKDLQEKAQKYFKKPQFLEIKEDIFMLVDNLIKLS